MIRIAVPLAFLIVAGCSKSIAEMDCSYVSSDVLRLSKGDIVAINNRSLTSKNDERITCHGTALRSNGQESPIRFAAFRSDDGRMLVKYDNEEYEAALEAKARRDEQQREDADDAKAQAEWHQAMDDARYEAAVAAAPQ